MNGEYRCRLCDWCGEVVDDLIRHLEDAHGYTIADLGRARLSFIVYVESATHEGAEFEWVLDGVTLAMAREFRPRVAVPFWRRQ